VIAIGIDPGVLTGIAVSINKKLELVGSFTAVFAENLILEYRQKPDQKLKLFIEDARQRKWVTGGREKLQGVGSVKRDCSRWEEFCKFHGIDLELIHPKNNTTKLDAKTFKNLTGWEFPTNEHSRDAAMLIWGR
jgi:hypothetical protein